MKHRTVEKIANVEELFLKSSVSNKKHKLEFITPSCFKSYGKYVNFPSNKRIIQNIVFKWNGCIEECPIKDVDGNGIEAISIYEEPFIN